MPVGCEFAESMAQLPCRLPPTEYLKTLSAEASLTTHSDAPFVTMSLGFVLLALRLKLLAAF
jgi:hypothetical protein